jgi:hypothetical protein
LDAEKKLEGSENDISQLANKSINWFRKNSNDQNFARLETAIRPVRDEYENFLSAGGVPGKEQRAQMDELLSDKTTPKRAAEIINTMSETVAERAASLNERWKQMFNGHSFPNLIEPGNVAVFSNVTNPRIRSKVAEMRSGGTITGRADGSGSGGRSVGELLGWQQPQAPQQSTAQQPGVPAGATQAVKVNGQVVGHIVNGAYKAMEGQGQ